MELSDGQTKKLTKLLEDFRRNFDRGAERSDARDLAGAITDAVGSKENDGTTHKPHQRRLHKCVYKKASDALLGCWPTIESSANFDNLHYIVESEFKRIRGAGPLFAYDVAYRIGLWLAHRAPERYQWLPDKIYLHAGTAQGAKLFGVKGKIAVMQDFPECLRGGECDVLESFLCVEKLKIQTILEE